MKSYREMTESVLKKAGTVIKKRERRRRNVVFITASSLCFALLLTVLGMGMEHAEIVPTQPGEQPGLSVDVTNAPDPTQQAKVKITYLTNIEDQTTQELVSPDVSMPLGAMIRVRDIRGLSEEEVVEARQEEMSIAKEFGITGKSSYTKWEYPGHITTIVSNGGITLDFSDCATVENVAVETTEVGLVTKSAHLYGANQEEDTIYWPNVREANFNWSISGEFAFELDEDPTIPLESIRDVITIKIDYTDGTAETLIFDITVNEEGYIFVTQRGVSTTAA